MVAIGFWTRCLGDLYTFDSTWGKKTLSANVSSSYKAALWLETECKYKPFYHEMTFGLNWDMLGLPDAYSKAMGLSCMAIGEGQ